MKSRVKKTPGRIDGYDIARGLAVLVMIILNFRGVLSGSDVHPRWLDTVLDVLDRRAAVALVMISGAGVTLFSRASGGGNPSLFRRGLFLIIAGMLLIQIWSGDILHVYGVMLCLGAVLAPRPSWILLTAGGLFAAGVWIRDLPLFDTMQSGFDNVLADGMADLLFTGYFPLFPWAAFFVAGMGLGRTDLTCRKWRIRFWVAAAFLMACAAGLRYALPGVTERIDLAYPTPLSVVSGLGSGLVVILTGCALGGLRRVRFFTAAGKTSLTCYVLHILVLVPVALGLGSHGLPDLVWVAMAGVCFFVLYTATASVWLVRWGRGPLEFAMRRF